MSVHCKAEVVKSLRWRHFYATNNGKGSNRCCPKCEARGGLGQIIVTCLKVFSGCLKPGHDGGIFQKNIPLHQRAGDDCESGSSAVYGWKSGVLSCANLMNKESWTGVRVFWMGASLPLKKGRRSRKNQARKGNEVDGGGRRLGYPPEQAPGHT